LDALEEGGGGLASLLRQAVGALLNAAHDDLEYPYSVEQVLDLVAAARTTGEFEPVKELFEAANGLDCPLPAGGLEAEPMSVPIESSLTPAPSETPTELATVETPAETPIPEEPTASAEPSTEPPSEAPTEAPSEMPTEEPEPSPDPEPPATAEG
jgi:hypothetical protein